MNSIRPKLVPTLLCVTVVGLFAALLPYPGFNHHVNILSTNTAE
ncbi:hypothetical protein [Kovacikia minuta]|nr:hypothetical protein [Kovacikia minuta]